jgi:hypothetical protein
MLSALLKRKVDAHFSSPPSVIITVIITNIAYFDCTVPLITVQGISSIAYAKPQVVIFTLGFKGSRALGYLDVYKNVRLRCYALSCQNI